MIGTGNSCPDNRPGEVVTNDVLPVPIWVKGRPHRKASELTPPGLNKMVHFLESRSGSMTTATDFSLSGQHCKLA
jgi:hypothetical protein